MQQRDPRRSEQKSSSPVKGVAAVSDLAPGPASDGQCSASRAWGSVARALLLVQRDTAESDGLRARKALLSSGAGSTPGVPGVYTNPRKGGLDLSRPAAYANEPLALSVNHFSVATMG